MPRLTAGVLALDAYHVATFVFQKTRCPQSHPLESHLQRACKAAVACAVPTSYAAEAAAGHAGELRPGAGREGAVGEGSAVLCPWEEAA
jgi:hypothetical protein